MSQPTRKSDIQTESQLLVASLSAHSASAVARAEDAEYLLRDSELRNRSLERELRESRVALERSQADAEALGSALGASHSALRAITAAGRSLTDACVASLAFTEKFGQGADMQTLLSMHTVPKAHAKPSARAPFGRAATTRQDRQEAQEALDAALAALDDACGRVGSCVEAAAPLVEPLGKLKDEMLRAEVALSLPDDSPPARRGGGAGGGADYDGGGGAVPPSLRESSEAGAADEVAPLAGADEAAEAEAEAEEAEVEGLVVSLTRVDGGLGLSIECRASDEAAEVVRVEASSAAAGRVRVGDIVVGVDSVETEFYGLMGRLAYASRSTVRVKLRRGDAARPRPRRRQGELPQPAPVRFEAAVPAGAAAGDRLVVALPNAGRAQRDFARVEVPPGAVEGDLILCSLPPRHAPRPELGYSIFASYGVQKQ